MRPAKTFSRSFLLPTLICIIGPLALTTYANPQQAGVPGAAVVASVARPATVYPTQNAVPPIDSPEVQRWLKELDLSGAPAFQLNTGAPPACPANLDPNVCYRTCQKCHADDVLICPDKDTWGLTFDDGPTDQTPDLLTFLKSSNTKATFFLLGSNVVKYPEIVKTEIEHGHHIASHTWSHHALTTLSNEQIVAEMKWTEKAIEDFTGYRVKYMRPPYGDIDNRVRFVLKKMGYIVVDWTSDAYDTNDWKIALKQASVASLVTSFQSALLTYKSNPAMDKGGFISLEHDLSVDTVAVAKQLVPFGIANKLAVQSVAECLRDRIPYAAINGAPPNAAGAPNTTAANGDVRSLGGQGNEAGGANSSTANRVTSYIIIISSSLLVRTLTGLLTAL